MAITLTEFAETIRAAEASNDLSQLEKLEKCFTLKEGQAAVPFSVPVAFRAGAVKGVDTGFESDAALTWANSLSRAKRRVQYRLKLASGYDGPIVVAEGDSWFEFPIILDDVLDHLMGEFAVYSLAAAGDLLADMFAADEFPSVVEAENADFFLLSGGGNDMLHDGQLKTYLKSFETGMTPDDIFLPGALDDFLTQMISVYRQMIQEVVDPFPKVTVLFHGYDYALPVTGGKWLGGPLSERGVPKALWAPIVHRLIDRFNVGLKSIESLFPGRAFHVDCRDTVGAASEWHDELHPKSPGFGRAAEMFAERIRAVTLAETLVGGAELAAPVRPRRPRLEVPISSKAALLAGGSLSAPDQAAAIMKRQSAPAAPVTPAGIAPAAAMLAMAESIIEGRGLGELGHAAPPRLSTVADAALKAWRDKFSAEDRIAYNHYRYLMDHFNDPEDPETLAGRAELLGGEDAFHLERIIGDNDLFPINFLFKGERIARAVGRIAVIGPLGIPAGFGTGFLVGNGLLLTNNHVLPDASYVIKSQILFEYEYDADNNMKQTVRFALRGEVFFTSRNLDCTFASVETVGSGGRQLSEFGQLQLLSEPGKAIKGEYISIIQHPSALPKQIAVRDSQVIGRKEQYIYYTTDTNPGSSGAPVVNDQWFPVALHHRSVPDYDRVDSYACNRGIRISAIFEELEKAASAGDASAKSVLAIIRRGDARAPVAAAISPVGGSATEEKYLEPFHAPFDAAHPRGGYQSDFLGIDVPLPTLTDAGLAAKRVDNGSTTLTYEHFSIVMSKKRRIAFFTASNVDAALAKKRPEPGLDYSRKGLTGLDKNDREKWFEDPRISSEHQLPDRFFDKDQGAFDKGHLVRREDVTWGDSHEQIRLANGDTFHLTNCSPQVKDFNRSNLSGIWGELENIVLAQAKTEKYCVFAGPILDATDRSFRGKGTTGDILVQIPAKYWKVIVARKGNQLQSFVFLLEQDLSGVPLEFQVDAAWKTRMVSVPALETLVRYFTFPDVVHDSDQKQSNHGNGELLERMQGIELFDRV